MSVRWLAFDNLGGVADLSVVEPGARATPLRPHRSPCAWLIVQNAATNRDGSANLVSVWIGDAVNQPFELRPGEATERMPVAGAELVFIRSSAPATLPPDPLPDQFAMLLFNRVTVAEEV